MRGGKRWILNDELMTIVECEEGGGEYLLHDELKTIIEWEDWTYLLVPSCSSSSWATPIMDEGVHLLCSGDEMTGKNCTTNSNFFFHKFK